jgi:tight adherence protein B
MFIFNPTGKLIVSVQATVFFLYIAISVLFGIPYWPVGLLFILAGPALYVEQERRKRLEAIEFQVDNFVLALANALKTTPSIGGALNSVVTVVAEPIRSEVEMVTKEMKVGSTLDQSLLHMAARIGSRSVDTALSAVLIGRTVGGNLPRVLETTAGSLREMQRLEGVIRSKTADGRMQLWVIGAMPAVLLVLMNVVWPGYFAPLTDNFFGYVVVVGVVVFWGSAIVVARKVLAVDI